MAPEKIKPKVRLDTSLNTLSLLQVASHRLERIGEAEDAARMRARVYEAKSPEQAMNIMLEYVEAVE